MHDIYGQRKPFSINSVAIAKTLSLSLFSFKFYVSLIRSKQRVSHLTGIENNRYLKNKAFNHWVIKKTKSYSTVVGMFCL